MKERASSTSSSIPRSVQAKKAVIQKLYGIFGGFDSFNADMASVSSFVQGGNDLLKWAFQISSVS
jgi:hypothetical protein